MTASEDELWQQAVRVPGTAVCGLPSSPLPPCTPAYPPSARLPPSSLSPPPHPPPAPCLSLPYWCGFRCCCSPWQYLFWFPPWSSCHWNKGRTGCPWWSTCPCSLGSEGEESRALCIPVCLCRQWACSVTSLEMPLNCCQIPLSAVQMEFNALPWLDAQCVRGGKNGAVSPPWRSISNLPCAMIIWVLDHASLPSCAHHLPYFPLIVPGISGSDMEAFQRGAARQDSFWGEKGCAFGLFVCDCALPTTHL